MLADHHSVRIGLENRTRIILQDGDTRSVVIAHIAIVALALGESFREVESESVEVVFVHQVDQAALDVLAHHQVLVVKVVIDRVWVRCGDVIPRVVLGRATFRAVPVESRHRVNSGGVVIDHVQQYGDSAGVTFVDEMLVHLACTIGLVQSEVGSRVIAPAVVTVELLARHKLYRVNSQIFKVVELLECTVDVVCGAEIPEMELVDDEVVLILYLKVLILPLESRFRSLESSHDT